MATDWDEETPPRIDRHLIGRAFGYFLPYWRRGVLSVVAIAVGAVLGLVPALIAKKLIDHLSAHSATFSYVAVLVAAGLAAAILNGILNVGGSYLSTSISQGIMADCRWQLFDRLLGQSVGFFTRSRTGDVMSRINNDVGRIEDVISDTIFGAVRALITLGTTLAFMFVLDWRLTLVAMVALPLSVIPSRYIGRTSYRARQHTQRKLAEMSVYLQEVLGISGMLLVKAFAKERSERDRFQSLNRELRRLEIRQEMINNWYGVLLTGLTAAGPAIVWLYERLPRHPPAILARNRRHAQHGLDDAALRFGRQPRQPERERARLTGALPAAVRIPRPAARGRRRATHTPARRAARSDRLRERLLHLQQRRDPPRPRGNLLPDRARAAGGAGRPERRRQDNDQLSDPPLLRPERRHRAYRRARPARDDARVDRPERRRRLPGDLSLALLDPRQPPLRLPRRKRRRARARGQGCSSARVICTLPDGYDTIVGERGHRLSGGEKQRMAIARVILKNSPILILDEATSHLDSLSEQLIQAALRPLFAGRTSIVIAHRLSTILAADTILVFDQGQVVEQGDHTTLVAQGGLYARLYERQFLSGEPESQFAALA